MPRPARRTVVALTVGFATVAAAIAAPGLFRVCTCGSEAASAIGALRAISSAEQMYAGVCGQGRFAIALSDLAAPARGSAIGFISPDLDHDGVIRNGYAITLVKNAASDVTESVGSAECAGRRQASAYFASAAPVGAPANRFFYATDASGSIYRSARPIANPIAPGPDVVVLPGPDVVVVR